MRNFLIKFTALFCFALASQGFTQDDKPYFAAGIKAQADQQYEQAVENFTKSLENEGESPEVLNNLGASHFDLAKKHMSEAYKHYKKAESLDPKNEVTLEHLGTLYISQSNFLKAKEILQKLKKMESTEAETLKEQFDKLIAQIKAIEKK